MQIIKIENGVKKLCIVAETEEEKAWIKAMGNNLTIEIITENASILGTPVNGSLLLTQKEKTS